MRPEKVPLEKRVWCLANFAAGEVGARNESTRSCWLEGVLANIPAGSRLLDAGCGEQQYRKFCAHLRYVGQDFGQYDGHGDGVGLQTGVWDKQVSRLEHVCDVSAIPEPDGAFDAVMCTEVLEHIPDPLTALREFARLLRPGGWLVLTAPFCSLSHFTPFHFCTGFSRYWYRLHLGRLGFQIVEIRPNGDYFEFLAQELRRLPGVAKRHCHGPVFVLAMLAYLALAIPMLGILRILATRQRGSEDLLCFGYHVVARRI